MAIALQYQPPTTIIDGYNQQIRETPTLLTAAYGRNTGRLRSRWLAALRVVPPAAQNYYPLRWKSAKQRRAFFATDGFGAGIPYRRTGKLAKAWEIDIASIDDGGEMTVRNTSETSIFVYGSIDTERQPMFSTAHGGVPWIDPVETGYQYMDEAVRVLDATLETISSPTAGV